MFAELARRLGLPAFGSARRDAALADRDVDDEVVAESIMASARRPWAEVRAAPHGIRDDSVAPGWLVPGRLPQRLDLAPVELVAQLAGRGDPADADVARADQPAHAAAVQLAAPPGRRAAAGRPRRRCSCTPTTPPLAGWPTATSP